MICPVCLATFPEKMTFRKILFPTKNPFQLCCRCQKSFEKITTTKCPGCSRLQENSSLCSDCQIWQEKYPKKAPHHALFTYNEALANWLFQYKYQKIYHLRFTFQEELQNYFRFKKNRLLVPIPLAKEKRQLRGFNQVESFLLGSQLKVAPLLIKEKHTETSQSQKNKQERLALGEVFQCLIPPKKEKRVILIDDVYTTGATLVQGQKALEKAGYVVEETFSLGR